MRRGGDSKSCNGLMPIAGNGKKRVLFEGGEVQRIVDGGTECGKI